MAVNKVVYNGETLVDLTNDTVTPETLAEGVTAHDASGAVITGTMKPGGGGANEPTTISGINLHDKATDIQNTYLEGATVNDYNGWTTTDFIPVEDGKFYLAYSTSVIDSKYCSKFNANKGGASALSGQINCTNKNRPMFITGHDGYFRFSGARAQIAAFEFYEVINFDWKV